MNEIAQNQVEIAAARPIVICTTGLHARWFKNIWIGARGKTNPVVAFMDEKPISFFQNGVDDIPVVAPTALLASYTNVGRPFIFFPIGPASSAFQQLLLQFGLRAFHDFAAFPAPPDYTLDWLAFYPSWAVAQSDTDGYGNSVNIEQRVLAAKKSHAAPSSYNIGYSDQRLFTPFALINDEMHQTLKVVDFGGAMGEHFFRFKAFVPQRKFAWHVWETESMAKAGELHFSSDELKFVYKKEQIGSDIDVVLASSSLHYIPDCINNYEILNSLKPKYFLIDRTPFTPWPQDRIVVQRVFRNTPEASFETSYPTWFFSEVEWLRRFESDYKIVMKWPDTHDIVDVGGERIIYSGFLLKRL